MSIPAILLGMGDRHTKVDLRHGGLPDPQRESLVPDLEISLGRELRGLLKTQVDGPHDTAVALGARSLSETFAQHASPQLLSIEDARATSCVEVGGFMAWPIFITYAGGSRDPYAAVYNARQVEERLGGYIISGPSPIRGGIGEAIRNVGQHGHDLPVVGYERCCFAPAALFVKELSIDSNGERPHGVLLAVVADEGSGIRNPQRSLLNGVRGVGGDAGLGMGHELNSCLLYLVKSTTGEWNLFDKTRVVNPEKSERDNGFRARSIGEDELIERVGTIDLPAPSKGCQKVMFFSHPSATPNDVSDIRDRLVSALRAIHG